MAELTGDELPASLLLEDARGRTHVWGQGGDLAEVIEECAACLAAEVECEFHAGFAAGWDACAMAMAAHVEAQRLAELVPVGDEVEERWS